MSNTAWGYAIVMGTVLIAVIVYSFIKLRKQAEKAEKKEKKKENNQQ